MDPRIPYRIDRIRIVVDLYIDIEGPRTATLDYVPRQDDPFAHDVMQFIADRNREIALAAGEANPTIVG